MRRSCGFDIGFARRAPVVGRRGFEKLGDLVGDVARTPVVDIALRIEPAHLVLFEPVGGKGFLGAAETVERVGEQAVHHGAGPEGELRIVDDGAETPLGFGVVFGFQIDDAERHDRSGLVRIDGERTLGKLFGLFRLARHGDGGGEACERVGMLRIELDGAFEEFARVVALAQHFERPAFAVMGLRVVGIEHDRRIERADGLDRVVEIEETDADRVLDVGIAGREQARLRKFAQRFAEHPLLLIGEAARVVEHGMALAEHQRGVRQKRRPCVVAGQHGGNDVVHALLRLGGRGGI